MLWTVFVCLKQVFRTRYKYIKEHEKRFKQWVNEYDDECFFFDLSFICISIHSFNIFSLLHSIRFNTSSVFHYCNSYQLAHLSIHSSFSLAFSSSNFINSSFIFIVSFEYYFEGIRHKNRVYIKYLCHQRWFRWFPGTLTRKSMIPSTTNASI